MNIKERITLSIRKAFSRSTFTIGKKRSICQGVRRWGAFVYWRPQEKRFIYNNLFFSKKSDESIKEMIRDGELVFAGWEEHQGQNARKYKLKEFNHRDGNAIQVDRYGVKVKDKNILDEDGATLGKLCIIDNTGIERWHVDAWGDNGHYMKLVTNEFMYDY